MWQERPGFSRKAISLRAALSRIFTEELPCGLAFQEQARLDCPPVDAVPLNLNCRDEIIPILRALQHVYEHALLRDEILEPIGKDVNPAAAPTVVARA